MKELHFSIGPACADPAILQEIMRERPAVCRVNLSHATQASLQSAFGLLRGAGVPRIAADIRGRKVRIGPLEGGKVTVAAEARFDLLVSATELMGSEREASISLPGLERSISVGQVVLLDDGAVQLRVTAVQGERLQCEVERGGVLENRCGVCLPGLLLDLPPLTAKDLADLALLAPLKPDLVYLSFTQTAADVLALQEALHREGLAPQIVPKIETSIGVENVAEIVAAAGTVCVARGDLGVELSLPALPAAQQLIIDRVSRSGGAALLAGEVLNSLVTRSSPSRGDVLDLWLGMQQGYQGFVLSQETASGANPVLAMRWLRELTEAWGNGK